MNYSIRQQTPRQQTPRQQSPVLEKDLFYFSIYRKLPLILAGITLLFYFIWGIVDPCVNGSEYSGYGIMRLSNGFLCWLVWMLIGIFCAVFTYFFLRVILSHKLLQIDYLQLQNFHLQTLTGKVDVLISNTKNLDRATPEGTSSPNTPEGTLKNNN